MANTCPPNPAVYNAKAIVKVLTGEHIPDCPKDFGTKNFQFSISEEYFDNNVLDKIMLGDNYPDPFTEQTTIPYKLPEETKGKIIITDVLGRTVEVITILQEENEIELKTNSWGYGIYYYSLEINNEIIDTKKMVIAR